MFKYLKNKFKKVIPWTNDICDCEREDDINIKYSSVGKESVDVIKDLIDRMDDDDFSFSKVDRDNCRIYIRDSYVIGLVDRTGLEFEVVVPTGIQYRHACLSCGKCLGYTNEKIFNGYIYDAYRKAKDSKMVDDICSGH